MHGVRDSAVNLSHASRQKLDCILMLGDDHLPSGYVKIAIEHGHRNSGFTHEKMVIFQFATLVYQRVSMKIGIIL